MKKKIKIDWKAVWKANNKYFKDKNEPSWRYQRKNIEFLVESQLAKKS